MNQTLRMDRSFRKPTPIRQTLTSKIRLLMANPLLQREIVEKVHREKNIVVDPQNLKLLAKHMANYDNEYANNSVLTSTSVLAPVKEINTPRSVVKNKSLLKRRSKSADNLTPLKKMSKKTVSFHNPQHTSSDRNLFRDQPEDNMPDENNRTDGETTILTSDLTRWLMREGKIPGMFSHLKNFGLDSEDKENIQVPLPERRSYDNLNIPDIKTNFMQEAEAGMKEILSDIFQLINEDYNLDRCEQWLKLADKSYPNITEDPTYWKCRAAIEQGRHNLNGALEHYQTAIIKGAEIDDVSKNMDNLLKQFSTLDINVEQGKRRKPCLDVNGVLKSFIIKYALREKNQSIKKNSTSQVQTVATPVRRSNRLSRSNHTSTPSIQIYESLKDISSPYVFTPNKFLFK